MDEDTAALRETVQAMQGKRVHIVGDTIIDTITQCAMIGGQTKTPTMSVLYEDKTDFVGGAGIVAKHMQAAGGAVTFSTVLGDDALKDFALRDLAQAGVETRAVIDPTRPTTNKNAIVVGGYRLLKVDTLDNRSIDNEVLDQLLDDIRSDPSDAVVYSDFRHGIFNKRTIPALISSRYQTLRIASNERSRWKGSAIGR